MARRKPQQFTIYDVMDQKGVFDANPANATSDEFTGPVEYPKMLYHPQGEMKITKPAEIIVTPLGPKAVGEQRELISTVANNAEDELSLVKQGWHLHPAQAMKAAGMAAPVMSAGQRLEMLEAEKRNMEKELNDLRATLAASAKPTGATIVTKSQVSTSAQAAPAE